ncbi:PEP-CTERM sorting domain-containing protein [Mitsuaria sp. CC2]|uniref:PEP-CTERM sorting domain-containing protein n=1 Tax=Mitsuaria sp. CC2 TaxID=3029186 RepID=UPI003B8D7781
MPAIRSFGSRGSALSAAAITVLALSVIGPVEAATFHSSNSISIRTSGQRDVWKESYGDFAAGEIRSLSSTVTVDEPGVSVSSSANVWSQAGWGWAKAYSQGTASIAHDSLSAGTVVEATGSAGFADTFIITCPTCVEGSIGRLYGGVGGGASTETRDGGRNAGGWFQTQTTWSSGVSIRSEGIPYDWENQIDTSYDSSGGWETHLLTPNGETAWGDFDGLSVSIEFVFGKPIHLSFGLGAQVLAWAGANEGGGQAWSDGLTDLGHTLAWGGLTVFANDVQINDFTALNAQGMDYALAITAVPEPGTWVLMLGGLAALGALARRRRS